MEKRIELEKRARKAHQITELNLDNCRSTSIVGLTDEYTALESLSLINVGLTTLKGFPKLPSLKKLELSDNRISNGLNYLTTSPKLQSLNLSGNKIKDLETLEPLQEFKHLSVLDLFNNEATQIDNYREKIFAMLPTLKFLDGFDCNDVEAPSDGEDDDEVNGNDSEDEDKQTSFCLNGLEIDLAELAEFERHVEAKKKLKAEQRQQQQQPAVAFDETKQNDISAADSDSKEKTTKIIADNNKNDENDDVDDLDLYLAQLKLKEANQNCDNPTTLTNQQQPQRPPINFAILLYWFLALINLAQATLYSADGLGEEEDSEDGDPSLHDDEYSGSDVEEGSYDEAEDDNSDFDENDDDDEDDEEDDEAATGGAAKTGAKDGAKVKQNNADNESADAAESEARGKKRKHDG